MSIDIQLHIKREEPTEADKAIELLRTHGFDQFADEIEARHEYGDVRVFDENVGGSIVDLAERIGLPECIWRPDEYAIDKAGQLIEPLAAGLAITRATTDRKTPIATEYIHRSNGTCLARSVDSNEVATTSRLASVVSRYLEACREHPDATVTVWR